MNLHTGILIMPHVSWFSLNVNESYGWLRERLWISSHWWIRGASSNSFGHYAIFYCHSAQPFTLQPTYGTLISVEYHARKVITWMAWIQKSITILHLLSLRLCCAVYSAFNVLYCVPIYKFQTVDYNNVLALRFSGSCHIRTSQAQCQVNSQAWQSWHECE